MKERGLLLLINGGLFGLIVVVWKLYSIRKKLKYNNYALG